MATYSEIKYALDQIAARNQRNLRKMEGGASAFSGALSDINKMPGEFAAIVSDIDAAAAANPNEAAYTDAKSEKDLLVSDFQALKIRVTALLAAIDGI